MERSLKVIEICLDEADDAGLSVVCFPECFLQGYTLDRDKTKERAVDLSSEYLQAILHRLSRYKTAFILGLIEKENDDFYNTAVVIWRGTLLGAYRKTHLFESNFTPGTEYPVFSIGNLTVGINICYDARFSEGAAVLARQGARVIFYPLNNRFSKEKAIKSREEPVPILIERARETGCWVVSSDVVARDADTTSYGCSAVVEPSGNVHTRVPELTVGMTTYELP